MSDKAFIVAKVREVRRRQFLSALIGSVCVTVIIASAVQLFLFLAPFQIPLKHVVMAVFLWGAALTVAIVLSVWKMPSWKDTVKFVDQSMGLQQRLQTAWECLDPHDEIESLLVADARHRVLMIDARKMVRIRFDRASRVALILCTLFLTGVAIMNVLSRWNDPQPRFGNTPQLLRGAASETAVARSAPTKKIENPRQLPAVQVEVGPQPGKRAQAGSMAQGDRKPDPASFQSTRQLPQAGKPDKGADGNASKPPVASGSASLAGEGASGTRTSPNKENKSPAAQSARSAGSGHGGALSGKGIVPSPEFSPLARSDEELIARYFRDFQAYRLAAEGTMAKQKIPPGLGKYIADYFNAIQR